MWKKEFSAHLLHKRPHSALECQTLGTAKHVAVCPLNQEVKTLDGTEAEAQPQTPWFALAHFEGDIQRLLELIRGLPDDYRAVVAACVLEGRTTADAADRLGLPRETVKKRLARGRRLLAELNGPSS